jgi:hypothetical protein
MPKLYSFYQCCCISILSLGLHLLPNYLQKVADRWTTQSYARAIRVTEETVLEKDVHLINHQDSRLFREFIRTAFNGGFINSKEIGKSLEDSLGWLKQLLLDLIFQVASVSIENIFTKLVECAILDVILYSQSFEEHLKAFLVSAAEVSRVACTAHFESN